MKWALGNWKMAQTREGLQKFISSWNFANPQVRVGIFPSFVHINEAANHLGRLNTGLILGAQDCSSEKSGAFTGEVSASSLKEEKCSHIIIGHSEKRQRAQETSLTLKAKLDRALEADLTPVFCVGETEDQRNQGLTADIVLKQLEVLDGASDRVLLAYEPVWAIGTGKTPTDEDIHKVHQLIRKALPKLLGVLYGGSVKVENAKAIGRIEGVSGFLVGGASLEAQNFKKIAEALV